VALAACHGVVRVLVVWQRGRKGGGGRALAFRAAAFQRLHGNVAGASAMEREGGGGSGHATVFLGARGLCGSRAGDRQCACWGVVRAVFWGWRWRAATEGRESSCGSGGRAAALSGWQWCNARLVALLRQEGDDGRCWQGSVGEGEWPR
jgi:hypothetical protein